MSESVIADFVAKFNSDLLARTEPVKGRVILSQKRLVLAAGDSKATIPLSDVFDIAVGHVPPDLGDFFDSTVTIAFKKKDKRLVAAVEGDDDKIEKFSTVLFKALLNSTETTVQHPAKIGGRLTNNEFEAAKLFLKPKAVHFRGVSGSFKITLASVTKFERMSREIGGTKRPVLAVKHLSEGQSMSTLLAMPSARKLGLLGRYLRLELSDLMNELKDIELSDQEIELLVAVYSTGDMEGVPLANVMSMDSSRVTMLVNDIEEKQLIATTESGPRLTPKGRVVVNKHLDDVNE